MSRGGHSELTKSVVGTSICSDANAEATQQYVLGLHIFLHQSNESPADLRTHRFELMLIRLLHLLAHHPDFAATAESLPEQAKCVEQFCFH